MLRLFPRRYRFDTCSGSSYRVELGSSLETVTVRHSDGRVFCEARVVQGPEIGQKAVFLVSPPFLDDEPHGKRYLVTPPVTRISR